LTNIKLGRYEIKTNGLHNYKVTPLGHAILHAEDRWDILAVRMRLFLGANPNYVVKSAYGNTLALEELARPGQKDIISKLVKAYKS